MKNCPLVSVLIPAYNHEQFIAKTLTSAINQDYPNIELVVIDDGSRDCTWERICELEGIIRERFKKVILKRQSNQGVSNTFKRMTHLASGDFVLLIASDDILLPNCASSLVDDLKDEHEFGVAVGDNRFVDVNENQVFWNSDGEVVLEKDEESYPTTFSFFKKLRPELNNGQIFGSYSSLLRGNYIPNGWLVRRALIKDDFFAEQAPLEDYFFMLQLSKVTKFKFVPEVLVLYRQHNTNTRLLRAKMMDMTLKTLLHEKRLMRDRITEPDLSVLDEHINALKVQMRIIDQ